jgi:hypothetical protein
MQRTSLLIAITAGLGLAGAIAYAANRGAIAPVFGTSTRPAAASVSTPTAASGFATGRANPAGAAAKPAPPPTNAQVGDAESFGRNVRWLGMASNGVAAVNTDCAALQQEDPTVPCQQVNDYAVDTRFSFSDLGKIELPAGAANSMLCHWLTPFLQGYYYTESTTLTVGRIAYSPNITIESAVLNNPAMINPVTGAPFNGRIVKGAGYEIEQALLQQGLPLTQVAFRQRTVTCAGALVSKQQLVDTYGLTHAQADQFFASPITLRFGVSGAVRNVNHALLMIGARVVGD